MHFKKKMDLFSVVCVGKIFCPVRGLSFDLLSGILNHTEVLY